MQPANGYRPLHVWLNNGLRILACEVPEQVRNVTFLDPVAKAEVPDYLAVCDAALIPLKKEDIFKTVIPSKIFEAAAMQRPILLGVDGQARAIVEPYGAGLYFEPENRQDFVQKVKQLCSDTDLFVRLQQGCKTLAEAYQRRTLAMQMLNLIENVAGGKR